MSLHDSGLVVGKVVLLGLVVSVSSASGQYANVFNIPPDPAPTAIGSNTQLNLFSGGELPSSYSMPFQAGAADGTSTNVQVNVFGGTVGSRFQANSGSQVNLFGGTVGGDFTLHPGSELNLFDGTLQGLQGYEDSQINVSGGHLRTSTAVVRSDVKINGGTVDDVWAQRSELNVSGGTVYRLVARDGSQVSVSSGSVYELRSDSENFITHPNLVTISGGTFESIETFGSVVDVSGGSVNRNFNTGNSSVTISGGSFDRFMASGSAVTVSDGTFANTGFASSEATVWAGDLGELTANQSDVTIFGGSIAAGSRMFGTHLRLNGGEIDRGLMVQSANIVEVIAGRIGDFFSVGTNNRVSISDGSLGKRGQLHQALLTVSGGSVGDTLIASASEIVISGGSVDDGLTARSATELTITGGVVGDRVKMSGSQLNLLGGTVGNALQIEADSEMHIWGKAFLLSGLPIPGLTELGDSLVLDARAGQLLTGVLADGSTFDFALNDQQMSGHDFFDPDATLRLTLVPEPHQALVPLIGLFVWALRRRIRLASEASR